MDSTYHDLVIRPRSSDGLPNRGTSTGHHNAVSGWANPSYKVASFTVIFLFHPSSTASNNEPGAVHLDFRSHRDNDAFRIGPGHGVRHKLAERKIVQEATMAGFAAFFHPAWSFDHE